MNKKKIIEKWLQKAREDLRLVEKELKTADPVYDAVAFHIQQFVEKYLKAFLINPLQC
jgi:HEPN domain-containing protein